MIDQPQQNLSKTGDFLWLL